MSAADEMRAAQALHKDLSERITAAHTAVNEGLRRVVQPGEWAEFWAAAAKAEDALADLYAERATLDPTNFGATAAIEHYRSRAADSRSHAKAPEVTL